VQFLHCQRNRSNLLHELGTDLIGNRTTAGAGHEHAGVVPVHADFCFHAAQEFQGFFRLLGFVPLVIAPQHFVGGGICDYRLDGRRTHVESNQEFRFVVVRLQVLLRRLLSRTHMLLEWVIVLPLVIVHSVLCFGVLGNRSFPTTDYCSSQSPLAAAGTATPGTRDLFQSRVLLSMRSLTCKMN
jgi:hypothetical protein